MPLEIVRMILIELYPSSRPDELKISSNASIKAARLCCALFADLAAEHLYRDLWVYMEKQSFANLESISRHPKYRHMVQTIKFFPRLLSSDLLCRAAYENCVTAISYEGHDDVQMSADSDGKRKLSQQQLDDGFAEYLRLYDEQCEIISKAEELLYSDVSRLHGLWWFSIGFVYEILDKGLTLNRLGRIGEMARKTLLIESCDGWANDVFDTECAAMIFRTLAKSELQLHALDLYNSHGSLYINWPTLSTDSHDLMKMVLAPLKRLSFNLDSRDPDEIERALEAGHCRKSLQCAKDLESIDIEDSCFEGYAFHDLFSTFRWGHLKTLSLSGFCVASEELTNLLRRHSLTLKTVILTQIELTSGSWFRVLSEIKRWCTLQSITLSDVLYSDGEDEYFPGGCTYDFSEPLALFMCRGGPWLSPFPQGPGLGTQHEVDEEACMQQYCEGCIPKTTSSHQNHLPMP